MVKLPTLSFSGKESRIVKGIESHLALVQKTVDDFRKLLEAIANGRDEDAKACFRGVLDGEKQADAVHRKLSMEIAEGAFFGGVREDMLNLLEKLDNIADSAKDAARFLEVEESLDAFAVSLLRSETMSQFAANLVGAVSSLGDLIVAFKLGKKETLSRIPRVEEHEEAADTYKDQLMKQLFTASVRPNPVTVIQMRDFILVADTIANNAEEASDVILVLVAKGYC